MKRIVHALLALAVFVGCTVAAAQPAGPVHLVVPFAPAGAADMLGRIVAERLTAAGRQVIVDNKPGASGHVGAQFVAKASGDGRTLLVGTIGIHAAYASYRHLGYDPAKDLQPIMILGESPNIVLVRADSPYRTFADFLADAKAHPGQISYASAGPGSSVHMVTALFELASGVRMNHVPYKGSGPALVDLIGGQVQVMFDNMSSGLPQVRSGKLRALAVTSAQRDPRLPDVPTIAEAGVPGYAGTSWFTLAAPAGMPAAQVDQVNAEVRQALAAPEVARRYEALGVTFAPNTPAQAAAFIKSETVKWTRVIEASRLYLD